MCGARACFPLARLAGWLAGCRHARQIGRGVLVAIEDGVAVETVEALAAMGHRVERMAGAQRQTFGRGQIIRVTPGKPTRACLAADMLLLCLYLTG